MLREKTIKGASKLKYKQITKKNFSINQSQEKTSIKQSNITTRISTNIGTNKQNLEELKKQTLLNILSAKGVIYTYYKNNQLMRKQ